MDDTETDNPSAVDDTSQDTIAPEQEPEETQQFDDDGNPLEDTPEEEEELELDEETKLKLPKSQADKLKAAMLRQSDYTKKTTELAEARKAFEAERQSVQAADHQELSVRANMAAIDQQLTNYANVDWNGWRMQARAQDAENFDNSATEAVNAAFQQYQLLKDAKVSASNYLGALQTERQSRAEQEAATRLEQAEAELARDIPGWGPELDDKLEVVMRDNFGIKSVDLAKFDNPAAAVKVAHAAMQWLDHQAKQKKTQTIQKQQAVTPAAKATRTSAPPGEPRDTDAWMKWREKQVQNRA